jgi:hypothetical protein
MTEPGIAPADLQDWQCFCEYDNTGLDAWCARCGLSRQDSALKIEQAEQAVLALAEAQQLAAAPVQQPAGAAFAQAFAPGGAGTSRPELLFQGNGLSLLGLALLVALLSAITLGIYSFWGQVSITRWLARNTTLDGRPLDFSGTGLQFLGLCLLHGLLCAITFSIWLPWAMVAFTRWYLANIFYADTA